MAISTPALGILLPIQLSNSGYFNQGRDIMTQVKSNLVNLVLTKKGERILQPDFGCDVHRLIFEPLTDNTVSQIQATIDQSIKTWMPYLTINNVDIQRQEDEQTIIATITFTLNLSVSITDSITLTF